MLQARLDMSNLEQWSYLRRNPEDYLIVVNSPLFPNDRGGLIFDRRTRYFLGIEDDDLLALLIRRMRQAGVEAVESRDFHPEPTD